MKCPYCGRFMQLRKRTKLHKIYVCKKDRKEIKVWNLYKGLN